MGTLPSLPAEPKSLEECKLDEGFLKDLLLKTLYFGRRLTGQAIADGVRLPYRVLAELLRALREEQQIEVVGTTGGFEQSFRYSLTKKGHDWAQQALEVSQYVGPAPVPFDDYYRVVTAQSVLAVSVTREVMARAFSHLVLNEETLHDLGVAINRGRSLFVWGRPGNGKTTVGEVIGRMLPGQVLIPHALICEHHIVRVFDATLHQPFTGDLGPAAGANGASGPRYDQRWALCQRPFVDVGGELQMLSLDLAWDEVSKFYEAPLQLKANGGVLFIDDFGRQSVSPSTLLNRWIVPLEKRVDCLHLRSGKKVDVPFDVLMVFSTNLEPEQLCEEAFLRRIANKVRLPSPTPQQFAEIFRRTCVAKEVPFSANGLKYLYLKYYFDAASNRLRQPLRSCHPRDILDQVISVAKYHGVPPTLDPQLIDLAFRNTFVPPMDEEGNGGDSDTGSRASS